MLPTKQWSIRLFQVAGITVFLHWSWILFLPVRIGMRTYQYSSIVWNVLEYLSLFAIVLMHEFGHSLACRQVGGRADQIVLWPLGGVAYVDPPQRPGATLWSIAAGPLVNMALVPILTGLWYLSVSLGLPQAMPNLHRLLTSIWVINFFLMAFNLLPIYPLDGGQILRSLLWFAFGRARSLLIASSIGLIATLGIIVALLLMIKPQSYHDYVWTGIMLLFVLEQCRRGFLEARTLARFEKIPRRPGFACPSCKAAPPLAPLWLCGHCRNRCDIFESHGICPHCGVQFTATRCIDCGDLSPIGEWVGPAPPILNR
jgi:Zn-dependent protease